MNIETHSHPNTYDRFLRDREPALDVSPNPKRKRMKTELSTPKFKRGLRKLWRYLP